MRLSFILLLLLSWASAEPLLAQTSRADSTVYPSFKMMRAEEDYRFLQAAQSEPTAWWASLKYLPLGDSSFVSIGGDGRTEFQVLQNEEWKLDNNDAPLFLRFMLHADWRFGSRWRLFSQIKSGHAIGRNGPPFFLNVDRLDWHQLFLAYQISGGSTLEVGRRELSYGSRRLISIREGTNVRQSFDGVRWIWQQPGHRIDLLAYAYNPQEVGFFDNTIRTDQLLWGIYYVKTAEVPDRSNWDIYLLGVRNESPRFEAGTEREIRHSIGVRHWGTIGALRYNNEAVFQFGEMGEGSIRAWTISTDLSYEPGGKLNLSPGLKAEIISGDSDPADDRLQTFNALYPRGGYFGLLAVIGPANLIDVHPSISLEPAAGWNLNLDWDIFWRHQTGDGIYFPSGRLNIPGSSSSSRFIGHQVGMQIGTSINRFLEIEASYFYFFANDFLEEVTDGANFSQLGFSLGYKF